MEFVGVERRAARWDVEAEGHEYAVTDDLGRQRELHIGDAVQRVLVDTQRRVVVSSDTRPFTSAALMPSSHRWPNRISAPIGSDNRVARVRRTVSPRRVVCNRPSPNPQDSNIKEPESDRVAANRSCPWADVVTQASASAVTAASVRSDGDGRVRPGMNTVVTVEW